MAAPVCRSATILPSPRLSGCRQGPDLTANIHGPLATSPTSYNSEKYTPHSSHTHRPAPTLRPFPCTDACAPRSPCANQACVLCSTQAGPVLINTASLLDEAAEVHFLQAGAASASASTGRRAAALLQQLPHLGWVCCWGQACEVLAHKRRGPALRCALHENKAKFVR